mmetsp:Transcript_1757/g.4232  ORF Transcript_1757/g.4232 Transcript_1757/m.4232 type:complete len:108 (+) Transcript_1757:268-591(+)
MRTGVVAADMLAGAAAEAEEDAGNREIRQRLKCQPNARRARETYTTTAIPLPSTLSMAVRYPKKVRRKPNQGKQNRDSSSKPLFQQRPLIATRKHQVLSCQNQNSQR